MTTTVIGIAYLHCSECGVLFGMPHGYHEGGRDQNLTFRPLRNNRGKVTDYYVEIELLNGGYDFETFTFEDAIAWRDRFSTTRNAPQYVRDKSPWYDMEHGFHEQACKTLVRKLAKRTPLSVDMSRAQQLEDAADDDKPQQLAALVVDVAEPETMPSKAEQLRERLDEAKPGNREQQDDGDPLNDGFR